MTSLYFLLFTHVFRLDIIYRFSCQADISNKPNIVRYWIQLCINCRKSIFTYLSWNRSIGSRPYLPTMNFDTIFSSVKGNELCIKRWEVWPVRDVTKWIPKICRIYNLNQSSMGQKPAYYHCPRKTLVRERIFKSNPVHASVISQIPWIQSIV